MKVKVQNFDKLLVQRSTNSFLVLLYKGFLFISCEESGSDIIHFYSGWFFYFLNLDFGDEQCWFFNLFDLNLFVII